MLVGLDVVGAKWVRMDLIHTEANLIKGNSMSKNDSHNINDTRHTNLSR